MKVVEDVLIFDNDFDAHVERVRQVLLRCNEAGITLQLQKFVFAEPEVNYCGFKVESLDTPSAIGWSKLSLTFRSRLTKLTFESFCGLAQQLETFHTGTDRALGAFTSINVPQTQRLCGRSPKNKLLERAIKTLSDPRMLAHFDGLSPICLETDAAQSKGLGMAFWQQSSTGEWRLLQCASKHLLTQRPDTRQLRWSCGGGGGGDMGSKESPAIHWWS